MSRGRNPITYSNLVATLALFIALGGTGYALTLPKDSVGSRQIRENAVRSSEIARGAIRSTDVRNNSLDGRDIDESRLFGITRAGTAARADVASDAERLGRSLPGDFKQRCPAQAPTLHAGACVETPFRASEPFIAAAVTCGNLGGRLGLLSELRGTAVTFPAEGEWTTHPAGPRALYVLTTNGETPTAQVEEEHPYRCVFLPHD